MRKAQYGFVLVVAVVAGLIGEVVGSRLFPPQVLRALRFEAVDKRGEVRMALDKSGLTFFPWEVPVRGEPSEGNVPQDRVSTAPALAQPLPELPTGAPVVPATPLHKKIPHPACPQCFTYDCPGCYTIFEEVPGTGVILMREIPNPAPQLPEGVRMHDNAGRPIWDIGRQPYVGPTDEEPFSPELPIPLIELKRIQARHHQEIFSIPGVHGFGIGAKGFAVFMDPKQMANASLVPETIEEVPVEVVPMGRFHAIFHQATFYRPVPTSGTVGALRPGIGGSNGTSRPHIVLTSPLKIWTLAAGARDQK